MSSYNTIYNNYQQNATPFKSTFENLKLHRTSKNIQNMNYNEEAINPFFQSQYFEKENYSKYSSSIMNEHETRSSILASTLYEFDQINEDNPSNFFELEELSRVNSEYNQSSNTINNFNNYSPNTEFFSNDQEIIENKAPEYLNYFEDSNQIMNEVEQQQYQQVFRNQSIENENMNFINEYQSNELKLHYQENNEVMHHINSNLNCNTQMQCNSQLKNTTNNLRDQSIYNQLTKLSQQVSNQKSEIQIDSSKNIYYPQLNQNQYYFNGAQSENQNQEYFNNDQIKQNNEFQKEIQNVNNSQINQIQQENNTPYEQVLQEYQNNKQIESVNGFNYYEYFRNQQETNNSQIINTNQNVNKQEDQIITPSISFPQTSYLLQTQQCQNIQYNEDNTCITELSNGQKKIRITISVNNQKNKNAQKDTGIKSSTIKKEKENKNMENYVLTKIESQDENVDEILDEEDTKISLTKDRVNSSKKVSIDIHSSVSAALVSASEEQPTSVLKKEDEETLQKIDEMKLCNKKNVVKNIMNAFKNFILEAELKNTPKVNQNIVQLYNNNKSEESDNLQEIIKKFKRYINSKNFNHYSMRLLILHANYGPVLQYFLKGPIFEWAKSCKANDINSHFVMVDFLLLSFSDIKFIDELKRHEKKKAHYQ